MNIAISFLFIILSIQIVMARQIGDADFAPKAANPAYVSSHPKVIIDQGHNNLLTNDGRYNGIIHLLKSDGYEVVLANTRITQDLLKEASILYISAPLGVPNMKDKDAGNSPYTTEEIAIIESWVKNGGGLLANGDHPPMGESISLVLKAFNIQGSHCSAESYALMVPEFKDPSIMMFSGKQMDKSHPIIKGRNQRERISRVVAFSGQSLKGPPESRQLLSLDDKAVDKCNKQQAVSAKGRAEAVAVQYGKGRVVSFGDATVFTAKIDTLNKKKHGLNYPGMDNPQLALNTFHWLSGLIQ